MLRLNGKFKMLRPCDVILGRHLKSKAFMHCSSWITSSNRIIVPSDLTIDAKAKFCKNRYDTAHNSTKYSAVKKFELASNSEVPLGRGADSGCPRGLLERKFLLSRLQDKRSVILPMRNYSVLVEKKLLSEVKKNFSRRNQTQLAQYSDESKSNNSNLSNKKQMDDDIHVKDLPRSKHEEDMKKLAREISNSINGELMELDSHVKSRLSFDNQQAKKQWASANQPNNYGYPPSLDQTGIGSSNFEGVYQKNNFQNRPSVIERVYRESAPLSAQGYKFEMSPIYAGRQLNTMYVATTKDPHNRFSYCPHLNLGPPRKY